MHCAIVQEAAIYVCMSCLDKAMGMFIGRPGIFLHYGILAGMYIPVPLHDQLHLTKVDESELQKPENERRGPVDRQIQGK